MIIGNNDFARLALIEHHRWWIACDFAFEIRGQQNFDAALVREIAKAYGVVRGFSGKLPRSTDADHIGQRIADAVSRVAGMPATSLVDRYALLQDALNELKVQHAAGPAVRYDLISGLSKLLWFALRRDWTMFDDLAAKAVSARGSANSRGQLFYFKLEEAGFRDVVSRLNAWMTELDPALHRLRGERVIDKYLWLCGASEASQQRIRESQTFYLDALGPLLGKSLEYSAREFGARFGSKLEDFRREASAQRQA